MGGAREPVDPAKGVYSISTTADLTGVGIPTLRLYEQRGLLTPSRTAGNTRRYSHADLDRLHRITGLVSSGINLVAIAQLLALQDENATLRAELHHQQTIRSSDRSP